MAPDEPSNPQGSDPNAGADNNALGFNQGQPEKRPERYNTQFLVANFAAEERRTRFIVIGVVVAVLIAGGVIVKMTGHEDVKPQAAKEGEPAAGTPKAPAEKKADEPPEKKAEAPKAPGPSTATDTPK